MWWIRMCWIGGETNGGSAELEGGIIIVILYSMEAFALGIVVHCTASRSCTTAVLRADCDLSARRPSKLALLLIQVYFQVSSSAWQKRRTATQPHSHRCRASSDRLQLSYSKLDVRVLLK
jgi:hypothetical protein